MNKSQKKQILKPLKSFLPVFFILFITGFLGTPKRAKAQEEKLKNVQKAQMEVDNQARASQKRVTKMAEQTRNLLDQYRATLKEIENTKIYNDQLRKLIVSQKEEMVSTKEQIESVKKTSKNIYPFMLKNDSGA